MLKNYLKAAWRNLFKNKVFSFINVSGLAAGMAVAILIGLWIWDELSFNKYHQHYDRIAQVMEKATYNGTVKTGGAVALPLEAALRNNYGSDFKHIVISSWTENHTLSVGDKKVSYPGNFMGAEAPEMFSLRMLKGSRHGLNDPSSILISRSVAAALFGDADPINKVIKLDNKGAFNVAGVYEDLPYNTALHDVAFMAPWDYYQDSADGRSLTDWSDNSLLLYVQIADHADMAKVSEKIQHIKLNRGGADVARLKPLIFLQPMSKWHLYSKFTNGVNTGGAIQYVWLFSIIGIFVLLLACINFMNLSTARSEKRAKEVGIRKAVGSLRAQLISQFFCESFLIATLAFVLSLLLVWLILPFFNEVAGKRMSVLWRNPFFWIMSIGFTLLTGFIAGSYPALYLSSLRPVKVLKGTFRAGRSAAIPRKVLVVAQFTISVVLIIGTIIVFKQIRFAQDRPVGYSRDGLISIEMATNDLHTHFDVLRADLIQSGVIVEAAESSSPTTSVNNNGGGFYWKGKDPAMDDDFAMIRVSTGYGKTVGWQFTQGRDFSRQFLTDSTATILNEAAVKYMGLKDPLGEIITFHNKDRRVVGVVKDMVMGSPYDPIKPTVFYIWNRRFSYLNIKINPALSAHTALRKIEAVCKTYAPGVPFSYKFADDEYEKKFRSEERIGRLAGCFTILAILISCLGLFGMASFMAGQRIKEIGIRKVMGASVFSIWSLLSKDFVMLVTISLLIATPAAWYFMHNWLQSYQYRTPLSWWVFAAAGLGALLITLLTVSFQAIKAATINPIKGLRTE
jgi:ABC-type antimicrobial peptide transport system permease subunit